MLQQDYIVGQHFTLLSVAVHMWKIIISGNTGYISTTYPPTKESLVAT